MAQITSTQKEFSLTENGVIRIPGPTTGLGSHVLYYRGTFDSGSIQYGYIDEDGTFRAKVGVAAISAAGNHLVTPGPKIQTALELSGAGASVDIKVAVSGPF